MKWPIWRKGTKIIPQTKREDVQKKIPIDKISTTYRRLNYPKIILSYCSLFMLALFSIKLLHVIVQAIFSIHSLNFILVAYLIISVVMLFGVLICSWKFPIWFSKSMSREDIEELDEVKRYLESLQVNDLGICMDLIMMWIDGRCSPEVYSHLLLVTRKLLHQVERDHFNFLSPTQYDLLCVLINPERVFTELSRYAKRERLLEVSLILSSSAIHAVKKLPTKESRFVLESRLENCHYPIMKTVIIEAIETQPQPLVYNSDLQFRQKSDFIKIPTLIKLAQLQKIYKYVLGKNIHNLKYQSLNIMIIGTIITLSFPSVWIYFIFSFIFIPCLFDNELFNMSNHYNVYILQKSI